MKFLSLLAILFSGFFSANEAFAFFEKRYGYRLQDNRPLFRENHDNGVLYVGGGFVTYAGKISDKRGFGFSEPINASMYNSHVNQYGKTSNLSNSMGRMTGGLISIGYMPRTGFGANWLRHELEIGYISGTGKIKGVHESNPFCGGLAGCTDGSTGFAQVSYSNTQKYLVYNLYLQAPIMENATIFIGGGGGGVLLETDLTGTVVIDPSGVTNLTEGQVIGSSGRQLTYTYSAFIGGTYDLTDSIVMQGKIKGTIVTSPNVGYTNTNYAPGGTLFKMIGFEIGVLFGV